LFVVGEDCDLEELQELSGGGMIDRKPMPRSGEDNGLEVLLHLGFDRTFFSQLTSLVYHFSWAYIWT
jgi:hypothetical protein